MVLSNLKIRHIGDIIDSDEEKYSHKDSAIVDVISMDNPNPSMDKISVGSHTSTDNPSTDNSTSRNLNSFSRSMNLGGASHSHRSLPNQECPINDQEASSSRSNLPPQRKWTKSHPFELIIGDAGNGVKTRKLLKMNVFTSASFLRKKQKNWKKHFRMLIGFLPC